MSSNKCGGVLELLWTASWSNYRAVFCCQLILIREPNTWNYSCTFVDAEAVRKVSTHRQKFERIIFLCESFLTILLRHFQHLFPTAVLKLITTLSFDRTCKQLGSTGMACTKSSSLCRFCLCLPIVQFSWACHKSERTLFQTWRLAVDGTLCDCGNWRAKPAMVWIHWIRLPFSTLFAFCWRLQQMCRNNVWRRKLAFTVSGRIKATKCYMSRPANIIFHVHGMNG